MSFQSVTNGKVTSSNSKFVDLLRKPLFDKVTALKNCITSFSQTIWQNKKFNY
jgi:hypothetical protein